MNPRHTDHAGPSAPPNGCDDGARRYSEELIAAIQELIDERSPSHFEDAETRALGQEVLGRLDALIR